MPRIALGKGHAAKPKAGPSTLPNFPEWQGPPPGTFDPGLEAEVRASERGLIDLIDKLHREGKREQADVLQKRRETMRAQRQGLGDIGRERRYSNEDDAYRKGQLGIDFHRSIEDLSIAKQRGQADYERTLTDIQHRFAARAVAQQGAEIQQGTLEKGTIGASGAVRAAGQRHDVGLANTAHEREVEDLARQEGRITGDYGSDLGRLQTEQDRRLGEYAISGHRLRQGTRTSLHALARAAHRSAQDRRLEISQKKREQAIYSTDVGEQAYYQAHQNNPNIIFPTDPGAPVGTGGGAPHPSGPAIAPARPVYGLATGRGLSVPKQRPRYPRYY